MEFSDIWKVNFKKTAQYEPMYPLYPDDTEERSLEPGYVRRPTLTQEQIDRIIDGGPAYPVDPTTLHRCTVHGGKPETWMFDGDSPAPKESYDHSLFSPHECSEKKGDKQVCAFESTQPE